MTGEKKEKLILNMNSLLAQRKKLPISKDDLIKYSRYYLFYYLHN